MKIQSQIICVKLNIIQLLNEIMERYTITRKDVYNSWLSGKIKISF